MNDASPSAPAKQCVVCGKDVTHAKRTKDPAGHYYCDECYRARSTPSAGATGSTKPKSDRRIWIAAGVAFPVGIGIATIVYFWFTAPSRRTVVVSETPARATNSPRAPHATVAPDSKIPKFAAVN